MVSIVYGFFCIISTSYYFAAGNPTNIEIICGGAVTDLEYSITIVTTGYFIHDLLGLAYFNRLDKDSIFHHGIMIAVAIQLMRLDQGCNFWVGVIFIGELGLPFRDFRLITRLMGLSYTKGYYFFEDMYFALYFIGRGLIGFKLVWNILVCDKILLLLKIGGFPLYIRSIYFTYQMIQRI